jgi:hypothetical protein
MKSHVTTGLARGWLLAGLLAAGLGWLSPSTSCAGCSHYVTTESEIARAGIDSLHHFGLAGAVASDLRGTSDDGRPAPCSGWRCSRGSSPPISVSDPAPRVVVWGCIQTGASAMTPASSPFPHDDHSSLPRDRVDRLARPPR